MTNITDIVNEIKTKHKINISDDVILLKILRLFYVRHVEEFIANVYSESLFRCPVHLSIGQEAIAVGICSNLGPNDKIISTHRSHAHYLAKGGDLTSMFAEMMGKPAGCSKGRGGSMHLFDDAEGIYGSIPIVGSSLPIATGLAYAQKISKDKGITIAFQGDAAFETGQFSESLNFISSFRIPILIIMENNRFSTYAPINDRQSEKMNLEKIVTGIGIDYSKFSGDNLLEIDQMIKPLISQVRNGQPKFVEFDTFRRLEHCGPNLDDDLGYRTAKEINSYRERDPVYIIKQELINNKNLSDVIKIIEDFLPSYISKIYESVKGIENIHPLLTEQDCYHSL
jgi:pyruvate dehydrogenase E1 component alpha subunit